MPARVARREPTAAGVEAEAAEGLASILVTFFHSKVPTKAAEMVAMGESAAPEATEEPARGGAGARGGGALEITVLGKLNLPSTGTGFSARGGDGSAGTGGTQGDSGAKGQAGALGATTLLGVGGKGGNGGHGGNGSAGGNGGDGGNGGGGAGGTIELIGSVVIGPATFDTTGGSQGTPNHGRSGSTIVGANVALATGSSSFPACRVQPSPTPSRTSPATLRRRPTFPTSRAVRMPSA